ncbi:hypothetical protein VF14_03025 [Nostoc linckia z18]|uniref:Uncharacterized protein n=2 Tax=Nostoc linckia TaxID=92942 RepID=A0A9Q5ZH47_NOSLI|nr:hypothetical protein [Nostoc linckia]PHJ78624.1 hypothetical protein VF03_00495 [Nostoc linckia z2]PHJ85728.1 hypothetical protein VF06_05815 [Nostoc linckia z4]PHJ92230.1 hypothetical protein VF07_01800 [Nostoc linckia z6]PHK01234.1 hypothetical protein VF04_00495 [Nostoc linckia z7]PHK13028.1 hypothetical protein VF09_01540 [Nostoc linckia z9]PHK42356.1 hypothetical protein VF12_03040 [Nostoc linckia z15]PHK46797.1 hypothetical protein VF13_08910 [Nostoc linckia z16]
MLLKAIAPMLGVCENFSRIEPKIHFLAFQSIKLTPFELASLHLNRSFTGYLEYTIENMSLSA